MSISITDLLTPVTQDQARATFVAQLEALKVPASRWRKGGTASTILTVLAATYAGFSATMVAAIGAGFLETAKGNWLKLLAKNVYGVVAIEGTFASGAVTLTNAGGGIYDYDPGEFTMLNSTTQQTYVNTDVLHIGALATVTGVNVHCSVVGSIGTADPGDIDALVTQALGVTVTNPASVVGVDAELDEDLRDRCTNKLASLSVRGPRNAYVWAAKSATLIDGTPVNINRVEVSSSSSTGVVNVWIASPSGSPSADDLQAVRDFIEANVRPEAVTVIVSPITPVAYSPAITVWANAQAGVSAAVIQTAAANALTAFIASYPISGLKKPPSGQGYLYASRVDGAIEDAHPAIYAVDGATDLALGNAEAAVNLASVTVRLVTP
jgi:hypothetical protein